MTVYWDSREPYSCSRCGTPQRFHEGADHAWIKPTMITLHARMLIRRGRNDPSRWIPWDSQRIHYRKWMS